MHYPVGMRRACTLLAGSLTLACGSGAPISGPDTAGDTTGATAPSTGTGSTGATATTDSTGPGDPPTTGVTGGASETGTTDPLTGAADSTSTSGAGTSTGAQTDTSTGEPGTADTGQTADTGVVDACPCPDLVVGLDDGIFVLSKTAVLWKYFPLTNELKMLGAVDCGLPPSTFSMGVDREGSAWVQFSDKQIRKIDITDVSKCSDPGFVPGQDNIGNFGMAFVSNSAEDTCDRLHGNHYNFKAEGDMVAEFFSVDPDSLALVQLGKSNYGLAEVTGTGDGRAFLFAGPDPSRLVEVDKATGASKSVLPLPGVKTGGGFAFAFFAGDFYFFTDAESDGTSEVTHLDFDDSDKNGMQDLKVVLEDAPLRIVGAGVSTCAPVIPQ